MRRVNRMIACYFQATSGMSLSHCHCASSCLGELSKSYKDYFGGKNGSFRCKEQDFYGYKFLIIS